METLINGSSLKDSTTEQLNIALESVREEINRRDLLKKYTAGFSVTDAVAGKSVGVIIDKKIYHAKMELFLPGGVDKQSDRIITNSCLLSYKISQDGPMYAVFAYDHPAYNHQTIQVQIDNFGHEPIPVMIKPEYAADCIVNIEQQPAPAENGAENK